MSRDVAFEAAVLRGGLLVGLVHEREVPDWAAGLLGVSPAFDTRLAELCVAPIELSTMRETLYPLAREADPARVSAALLTLCAIAPSNAALSVADRVQQLQFLRFELRLPDAVTAGLQSFVVRLFDATDAEATHVSPSPKAASDPTAAADLSRWLDTVREPAAFNLFVSSEDEAKAWMTMLDAHRQAGARYRLERDGDGGAGSSAHVPRLLVNETAWIVAARERGPLPVESRIPDAGGVREWAGASDRPLAPERA